MFESTCQPSSISSLKPQMRNRSARSDKLEIARGIVFDRKGRRADARSHSDETTRPQSPTRASVPAGSVRSSDSHSRFRNLEAAAGGKIQSRRSRAISDSERPLRGHEDHVGVGGQDPAVRRVGAPDRHVARHRLQRHQVRRVPEALVVDGAHAQDAQQLLAPCGVSVSWIASGNVGKSSGVL